MDQSSEVLSCSFYAKIDKPIEEVFDAVYAGGKISGYFATGSKPEDLVEGTTVYWSFHDHPQFPPFPVKVVKTEKEKLIHLQWESGIEDGWTDIKIEFERLETNPNQTLVRVTESGWPATPEGNKHCTGNCGGWSNMLACLKVYVETGKNLREFFF